MQWEIDSAVQLASVMTDKLFKKGSEPYSMIYLGFAMSTKVPYVGMVEARNPLLLKVPGTFCCYLQASPESGG